MLTDETIRRYRAQYKSLWWNMRHGGVAYLTKACLHFQGNGFFHIFSPHFLNNTGRERDRSARILPLSSFQPMLMWRGVAGS